jgi:hypothetical protein
MPHRKLARRFEPRYGVSLPMVQQEATWLAREFDDVLIGSLTDLRDRLSQTQKILLVSDANIQFQIDSLPEREGLAIRCLLARDLYHLSALYEQFFQSYQGPKRSIGDSERQRAMATAQSLPPPMPKAFKEWLFDR